MESGAKMRPRESEPKDTNGEEDEVIEDAAGLPVTGRGEKEFTERRSRL